MAVPPTKSPVVQVKPTMGAVATVAAREATSPRIVFDLPNRGRPSRNATLQSSGYAHRCPKTRLARSGAVLATAQARSIPPDELRGATITLSNFGMIGGRFASLVVVPPQVAIIGAGRIDERAMVRNGEVAARRVLPLSLTFDHRVVTGGEAARFLVALKSHLERLAGS